MINALMNKIFTIFNSYLKITITLMGHLRGIDTLFFQLNGLLRQKGIIGYCSFSTK